MAGKVGATPPSLAELRKAYQACAQAGGGHCKDLAHAEALLAALEKEVVRLSSRIDRTGTVYRVPKSSLPAK